MTWGIGLLVAASTAGIAVADVYVTSPDAGQILVLNSSGAVVRVIDGAGALSRPYGVALDPGGNLLVTDYPSGRVLRFSPDGSQASVVASNIPKPDGLAVGPTGDLFLVSREDRTGPPRPRGRIGEPGAADLNQVWMVPENEGPPIQIAIIRETFRLAQTAIVPAGPYQSELLVLSTRPGLIARLLRRGPATFQRSADLVDYVPGEPTSMAFTRAGELLVSTSDGRLLRYSSTGARLQPDFATGLPVGPTRVSINADGVVHVTPVGGLKVLRFDPYGARLPDLAGARVPLAAAITDGCVPTPVGLNVEVSPAAGLNVIFDGVAAAGQTCLVTTELAPGVTATPAGDTIPHFARAVPEHTGFVVYGLATTAGFTDSVVVEFFSHGPSARVMSGRGSGQILQDVTVLATPGRLRARAASLSEFVVYLDTRPDHAVAMEKLETLQNALESFGERIDPQLLPALRSQVGQISARIVHGVPDSGAPQATSLLRSLISFVRKNGGEGIPSRSGPDDGPNPAGTLVSLADTLAFQLSQ